MDGIVTGSVAFTHAKKNCDYSYFLEQITDSNALTATAYSGDFDPRIMKTPLRDSESFLATTGSSKITIDFDILVTDYFLDTQGIAPFTEFRMTLCSDLSDGT